MRYSKNSQDRWVEWDGEGIDFGTSEPPVYYTYGIVHPRQDNTRELLARKLHRDGIADSLWHGFQLVDHGAHVIHGFVFESEEGDLEFYASFEEDDLPPSAEEATIVEVILGN